MRPSLAAAAGVSFAAAAYQLLASYELALILNGVWPAAVAVLFAANLCFGLGAGLAHRYRRSLSRPAARARGLGALGAAILASLAAFLSLSPAHAPWAPLALAVLLLLLCLSGLGLAYGRVMGGIVESGPSAIAAGAALSTVGYALGILAGGACGLALGVNVSLALLGAAFVAAAGRPLFLILPAGLAIFGAFAELDARWESLRPVSVVSNVSNPAFPKDIAAAGFRRIYSRWSPYAKVDIFEEPSTGWLAGSFNYRALWNWWPGPVPKGYPGFAFLRSSDKVALLGASAGFEVRLMPPDLPPENVTLVEIDPAVVAFFRKFPDKNGRVFERSPTVVMDGRSFLDRFRGRLDAVLIGSLDSTSRSVWRQSDLRSPLYTRQGVEQALRAAGDDGIVAYLPRDPRMFHSVARTAFELDLPSRAYYRRVEDTSDASGGFLYNGEYTFLVSRSAKRLAEADRKIQAANRRGDPKDRLLPAEDVDSPAAAVLDDDRPSLLAVDPSLSPLLKSLALLVLALFAAVACAAAIFPVRDPSGAYFCLIGCGFMAFELFVFHRWRSCFGDPASTFWTLNGLLFAFHGLGNAAAGAWRRIPPFPVRAGVFAAVAAHTAAFLPYIPFSGGAARAILVSAAILGPASFLSGLYLPWGLARAPKTVGRNLFLDATGTAFGLLAFFLLAHAFGLQSTLWLAGSCYLAATVLAGSLS